VTSDASAAEAAPKYNPPTEGKPPASAPSSRRLRIPERERRGPRFHGRLRGGCPHLAARRRGNQIPPPPHERTPHPPPALLGSKDPPVCAAFTAAAPPCLAAGSTCTAGVRRTRIPSHADPQEDEETRWRERRISVEVKLMREAARRVGYPRRRRRPSRAPTVASPPAVAGPPSQAVPTPAPAAAPAAADQVELKRRALRVRARGRGCGRAARNFSKKRVAYWSTVRSAAAAIITRWMGYTASAGAGGRGGEGGVGGGGRCQRRSSRVTEARF